MDSRVFPVRTHVRHTARGFDRDNQGLTRAFARYPVKLDQGGCQTSSLPGSDDLRDSGLGAFNARMCYRRPRQVDRQSRRSPIPGEFSPQKEDSVIRRRESRSVMINRIRWRPDRSASQGVTQSGKWNKHSSFRRALDIDVAYETRVAHSPDLSRSIRFA